MALDVSGVPPVRKSRAQSRLLAWKESFCKDVLRNLKFNLCSHLTEKCLTPLQATFRKVFKEVLLSEVSGSEKWSSKCAKGVVEICSLMCSGRMPWKAACLAQRGRTEKLREILLTSAHIKCISSLGFCTMVGLCRLQLVMNSRSEHSTPEGSKDSPRTGNSPSSEWEWTHVLLLQSQICSGWQGIPELN